MVSLARSPGPSADIVPAMVGGAGEDAPMTARDDAPAAERGDSMAAREDILARIGLALADHAPTEDVPRAYQTSTPADVDLVGLFAERVADYRATVHRCRPAVLAATIGTALAARVARRIVVPVGLDRAWLSEAQVEWIEDTPPLTHAELDGLDGVITACAVAIAETGTIVLDAGADQGAVPCRCCPTITCASSAPTRSSAVSPRRCHVSTRRPLTWISGPSATSDIELERVEGVHGPRPLEVVIVEPEEPPRDIP
jgi:L-lactate dehydrogenase complex protein LldG